MSPLPPVPARVLSECVALGLAPDEATLLGQTVCDMPDGFAEWLHRPDLSAHEIAGAWRDTLDLRFKEKERTAIFVYRLFLALFDGQSSHGELQGAMRVIGMNVTASKMEAKRRLTGALFHLGRLGEATPDKQKWLTRCIELIDELLNEDRFPSLGNVIRYNGFKGVACMLLARNAPNPEALYTSAAVGLQRSRAAGDKSIENGEYLVECCLHLADHTHDVKWLTQAEPLAEEITRHPKAGRTAWSLLGEVRLLRGFELSRAERPAEAITSHQEAEKFLTKSLSHPEDLSRDSDHILRLRGRARYAICAGTIQLTDQAPISTLDDALKDLRTKKADGTPLGAGGMTLPLALNMRARAYREGERYDEALKCLDEAAGLPLLGQNAADVRHSLAVTRGTVVLDVAMRSGDEEKIRLACEQLLAMRPNGRVPYPTLARGGRALFDTTPSMASVSQAVVEEIIAEGDTQMELPDIEESLKRYTASFAGGLALRHAKSTGETMHFQRAYGFYRVVVGGSGALVSAESFGLAGDAALHAGRRLLLDGIEDQAIDYLEDALAHFTSAIQTAKQKVVPVSESFREVVAYSKQGECALRLHALTGKPELIDLAISGFEQSERLGNNAPELHGLLGDAYYRRGRGAQHLPDLRQCVARKELARQGRDDSRENSSVSARVHFVIAELTGDPQEYQKGLILLGNALRIDPDWCWPLFQISELIETMPEAQRKAVVPLLAGGKLPADLVAAFAQGDTEALLDEAVRAVLRSREFARRRLGGRKGAWEFVYVLEDPHRLLSESYVFKHTSRANAERDRQTIEGFHGFLKARRAPHQMILPMPVRITAVEDDDVVYVMRKTRGVQLGRIVLQALAGVRPSPWQRFEDAIDFMAYFHAWSAPAGLRSGSPNRLTVQLGEVLGEEAGRKLASVLGGNWPLVRKKDAHPENWLVGASDRVVMLDFESREPCPLLLDLAQLLEDYPFLPVDQEGWKRRGLLINRYTEKLAELGIAIDLTAAELQAGYEALAVFRCAAGSRRQRRERDAAIQRNSSSTLRATKTRLEHAAKLLAYLAANAINRNVREAAAKAITSTGGR